MEVFVLLAAVLIAIAYALAGAFYCQDVSLVAPFALAYEGTSRVLILVGEA